MKDEGKEENIKIFCPTFLWLVENNHGAYLSHWSFVFPPVAADRLNEKSLSKDELAAASFLLCLLVFLILPQMKYIHNIKSVKWRNIYREKDSNQALSQYRKQLLNNICLLRFHSPVIPQIFISTKWKCVFL